MNFEQPKNLNAWIAGNVMGWKEVKSIHKIKEGSFYVIDGDESIYINDLGNHVKLWRPTEDRGQALEVLEKCIRFIFDNNRGSISQSLHLDGLFDVYIGGNYIGSKESGKSLPIAICLFAQKLFTP